MEPTPASQTYPTESKQTLMTSSPKKIANFAFAFFIRAIIPTCYSTTAGSVSKTDFFTEFKRL
jgi:hypothetical protein